MAYFPHESLHKPLSVKRDKTNNLLSADKSMPFSVREGHKETPFQAALREVVVWGKRSYDGPILAL